MNFSDYLKLTRLFYGLTQSEMAQRLGYKQSIISEVETKHKRFYYICWGLKTIHVVTYRNNECFPPTSAALFLSTLGGKK